MERGQASCQVSHATSTQVEVKAEELWFYKADMACQDCVPRVMEGDGDPRGDAAVHVHQIHGQPVLLVTAGTMPQLKYSRHWKMYLSMSVFTAQQNCTSLTIS